MRMRGYAGTPKRILDVFVSLTALILLSPVLLFVTLMVWTVDGGRPFYRQARLGWRERSLVIVKFRTMSDARDTDGNLLPNDRRISRLGALLRVTSMDELPQLWNVLRGDMSLVGPRPLLPHYVSLYTEQQRRRHEVRPGITGWAQVNGRNAITWHEKFELDVWYVDHVSLPVDVRILFLTLMQVARRRGINAAATLTMAPFDGTN